MTGFSRRFILSLALLLLLQGKMVQGRLLAPGGFCNNVLECSESVCDAVEANCAVAGEPGEPGQSCSVLATDSGADITCGEETVSIENGADGLNGTPCTVTATETGARLSCENGSVEILNGEDGAVGEDGESCTVTTSGGLGATTATISCGGQTATISDGMPGRDGSSCTVAVTPTGAEIDCGNGDPVSISNGQPGEKGEKGEKGDTGEKGPKGDPGPARYLCCANAEKAFDIGSSSCRSVGDECTFTVQLANTNTDRFVTGCNCHLNDAGRANGEIIKERIHGQDKCSVTYRLGQTNGVGGIGCVVRRCETVTTPGSCIPDHQRNW